MKAFHCTPCNTRPVTIYEVKGHTLMRYDNDKKSYKRIYDNAPVFFCYKCGSVLQYRLEPGETTEIFKSQTKRFSNSLKYRQKQADKREAQLNLLRCIKGDLKDE